MLSLPDIKQKQILLIQTDEIKLSNLKWKNDNITLEKDGKIVNQTSAHRVLAIFIVGDCTFTTKLIQKLLKFGITTVFLKYNLSYYTCFGVKAEGNYLVRHRQYTVDTCFEFSLAKLIIKNKFQNQINLLKSINLKEEAETLKIWQKRIDQAQNSDTLLGLEGNAAKYFFGLYFNKIGWLRRLPRTKFDIPNLLLDIGYTYLFNFIDSLLRLYGFDTYKGVYHKLFFQRKSLACDIIEPFRVIIERAVLKAYNLNQVKQSDFEVYQHVYGLKYTESKKYSQIFLKAIMDNKEEIFLYIQGYYRYFMKPEKYEFPEFKIR